MKHRLTTLLAVLLATLALNAFAAQRLFGTNPFNNNNTGADKFGLYEINPANAAIIAARVITVPARTITGATALTRDPTTGTVYAVVKASGVTNRLLVTLNLDTGVGVEIGDLGNKFSSLAFRPDGQLFGTTGNGGVPAETMYTINKATAATALAATLGNGADGEIIAYNPVDGFFYHFSGNATAIMEKFPSTAPYTPITNISGSLGASEVFGAVWDPVRNAFIVSDISNNLRVVSSTGVVTSPVIGTMPQDMRGMVLLADVPPSVVPVMLPAALLAMLLAVGAVGVNLLRRSSP